MKIEECIANISNEAPRIKTEFGVTNLRIFGSVARGEDTPDSDVDIFVEMPPKAFKVVELREYLQNLLGRAVDLVRNHSNINSYLLNEIQKDGITVIA